MVVYAFQDLLIDRLHGIIASDQIITGGWDVNDTQEAVYIRDEGGATRGFPDNRADAIIQVVARATTDFRAREIINLVYSVVREIYNTTLTFESNHFFVNKISAVQRPSEMGTSSNGLYEYVINYSVIFSENSILTEVIT
jgi:hypothetical protein